MCLCEKRPTLPVKFRSRSRHQLERVCLQSFRPAVDGAAGGQPVELGQDAQNRNMSGSSSSCSCGATAVSSLSPVHAACACDLSASRPPPQPALPAPTQSSSRIWTRIWHRQATRSPCYPSAPSQGVGGASEVGRADPPSASADIPRVCGGDQEAVARRADDTQAPAVIRGLDTPCSRLTSWTSDDAADFASCYGPHRRSPKQGS